jgi:hypothetical protein
MKTTKTFSGVAEPIYTPMQSKRGKGLTIMGVMDMNSHDSFYGTAHKTIKETNITFFENFFKHLQTRGYRRQRAF